MDLHSAFRAAGVIYKTEFREPVTKKPTLARGGPFISAKVSHLNSGDGCERRATLYNRGNAPHLPGPSGMVQGMNRQQQLSMSGQF